MFSRGMESATLRNSSGSVADNLPGTLKPLHGNKEAQASSSFSAKTHHRVKVISGGGRPAVAADSRAGVTTLCMVSDGERTLVMMPSVSLAARAADLRFPAAIHIGIGCIGGL